MGDVDGLLRAAEIAELVANHCRTTGKEEARREVAALARIYRTMAGEEITGVEGDIIDVAAIQSPWWRRAWEWLRS